MFASKINVQQLRTAALKGHVSIVDLLEIVEQQQQTNDKHQQTIYRLQTEVQRLRERLAQYEPDVEREGMGRQASAPTPIGSYSVEAEDQRRRKRRRRKKKSPGRRPTEVKFADAQRIENVYPSGVAREACQPVRERAVWRLKHGRAVLVGYRIFAGPGGREGRIPGVTPRCEYGIEILVVLSFLVYLIGISLDKDCAVLGFFCQLRLAKSQADALLHQLAQHWQGEFDLLCTMLAYAAVVYTDETGWKIGKTSCSLWVLFLATRLSQSATWCYENSQDFFFCSELACCQRRVTMRLPEAAQACGHVVRPQLATVSKHRHDGQ